MPLPKMIEPRKAVDEFRYPATSFSAAKASTVPRAAGTTTSGIAQVDRKNKAMDKPMTRTQIAVTTTTSCSTARRFSRPIITGPVGVTRMSG